MKILGIRLHWPSNRNLALTTALTTGWALALMALNAAGLIPNETVPISTSAVLMGGLAYGSGVSIDDHGWRAVALLGVIMLAMMGVMNLTGYWTPP